MPDELDEEEEDMNATIMAMAAAPDDEALEGVPVVKPTHQAEATMMSSSARALIKSGNGVQAWKVLLLYTV